MLQGMTILTMSASVHGLKPLCDERNVCHPTGLQIAVFFVGLYLIALGTGGIKPCVSSFGADQFDDSDEAEKKKKSSFFNWFYFSINIGALVAASCLVWIQTNVGWVGALASQQWLWPLLSSVSLQVVCCIDTKGLEGVR